MTVSIDPWHDPGYRGAEIAARDERSAMRAPSRPQALQNDLRS